MSEDTQNRNDEVIDKRKTNWFWVYNKVVLEKIKLIGPGAFSLYCLYCVGANKENKVWISDRKTSKILKNAPNTVGIWKKILVNNKLIKVEERKDRGLQDIVTILDL